MEIDWSFSVTWMIIGLVILIAGGAVVFFYRQISEGLANGVSSYDKVKRYGVIAIIVGIIVTANLHTFILEFLVSLILKR